MYTPRGGAGGAASREIGRYSYFRAIRPPFCFVTRDVRGLQEVSGATREVGDTLYHTWRMGLLHIS